MNVTQIVLYGSLFLFCTLVVQLLLVTQIRKNKYKRRMKEIGVRPKDVEKKTINGRRFVSIIKQLGAKINHVPVIAKWQASLLKGKSVLTPGEFFLYRVICMTVLAFFWLCLSKEYTLRDPDRPPRLLASRHPAKEKYEQTDDQRHPSAGGCTGDNGQLDARRLQLYASNETDCRRVPGPVRI